MRAATFVSPYLNMPMNIKERERAAKRISTVANWIFGAAGLIAVIAVVVWVFK